MDAVQVHLAAVAACLAVALDDMAMAYLSDIECDYLLHAAHSGYRVALVIVLADFDVEQWVDDYGHLMLVLLFADFAAVFVVVAIANNPLAEDSPVVCSLVVGIAVADYIVVDNSADCN